MEVAPASAEARRFGKYTLVAKLATGGMAEIFLARLAGDGGFEKLVCIKRILPHLARDLSALEGAGENLVMVKANYWIGL